MTAKFIQGHVLPALWSLPAESVHCCVTSPPYYGLRKYEGEQDTDWGDEWHGSLGLEPTVDQYVRHIVEVFQGVKRVLRGDGLAWLNIGDSYAGSGKGQMGDGTHAAKHGEKRHTVTGTLVGGLPRTDDLMKAKDLCLIPQRLALALQIDGWWVRSMVIWNKTNSMPESVSGWRWEKHRVKTDAGAWIDCSGCPKCNTNDGLVLRKGSWRPTDSTEYIIMLAKLDSYYADGEVVKESDSGQKGQAMNFKRSTKDVLSPNQDAVQHRDDRIATEGTGTRNLRQVWKDNNVYEDVAAISDLWTFSTLPFKGAHFACFPPRLPELCVKSSTSEKGCCPKCGSPWTRVIEKGLTAHQTTTVAWRPSCQCSTDGPIPCTVLDPFSGAGTTALVADRLSRNSINIDLSQEYISMAQIRLAQDIAKREVEMEKAAMKNKK